MTTAATQPTGLLARPDAPEPPDPEAFVAIVLAVYEKHGLRPTYGTYWSFFRPCVVCPLTALAIEEGVIERYDMEFIMSASRLHRDMTRNRVILWASGRFGRWWVSGFLRGMDGHERTWMAERRADLEGGYRTGQMLRERLFPKEDERAEEA